MLLKSSKLGDEDRIYRMHRMEKWLGGAAVYDRPARRFNLGLRGWCGWKGSLNP
jgi:hypothetical protein